MSVFRRDQYKPENACKTDGNCSIYALTVSFRQRYLFSLLLYAMPCDQDYRKADKNIIRAYLDGCAFDKRFTLTACNEQLKAIHTKPLTNLTSAKEDSE